MMASFKFPAAAGLMLLAAASTARGEDPRYISFVACPVMQDTNTVPCWLAESGGETYFLGIQTDSGGWPPPLQGHQVLVEGVVTDNPRVCGGVVLKSPGTVFDRRPSGSSDGVALPEPPVTSNMRELDANCRTVLPEQARYNTLDPRRGPGPSNPRPPMSAEQIAEARARAAATAEAEQPRPPYEAKTFQLHYEFDSELASLRIGVLQQAIEYAAAINASTMEIVGYRAAVLLSAGDQIEEIPQLAQLRAHELALVSQRYGLPESVQLKVRWQDEVLPGNGRDDWTRRRVDIIVTP